MNHQFVIEELPANPALTRVFERARRNMLWLNDHIMELEIFKLYRGRFIAVSEGELFVGDSPEEVEQLALAKHPEDVPTFVISRARRPTASMRVNGEWLLCDDGINRPTIPASIQISDGSWNFLPVPVPVPAYCLLLTAY